MTGTVGGATETLERVAIALHAEREAIAEAAIARRDPFPTYANLSDPELAQLRGDAVALLDALVVALGHGRALDAEDVAFLESAMRKRVRASATALHDTAGALRVLQNEVYERVTRIATELGAPETAVVVGARLLELIDVAATLAGEAWVGANELFRGEGARRRRELLERVVGAGLPRSGPLSDLARELGLVEGAGCVLVSARAAAGIGDRQVLSAAVGALSRAADAPMLPAAAEIDQEILVLHPVAEGRLDDLVAALERTWRRLADGPVRLAIGVSTRHVLPDGGRDALAEARGAREQLPVGGGLLALSRVGPLDWLTRTARPVALRLVPEPVRDFLAEDEASGGTLLFTFRGYTACDLNIKLAADRLHLHVNSVRYRLRRIEERTGLDLRRYDDVVALDVAARLFEDL
jgi:hypothetical protein